MSLNPAPLPVRFTTRSTPWLQRMVSSTLPSSKLGLAGAKVGGTLLGALLGLFLFHFWFAAVILGVAGFIAANTYLDWASTSHLRQFTAELPDMLLSLANALKASYSLSQAITRTAERGHGLAAQELRVSAYQLKLGARPLQAIQALADRVKCPEMEYVMLAFAVHTTVGGDLAQTLESAASTVQQRLWLQGEVHTATSEARVSSLVVCTIPLFFILLITRLLPHYYDDMLTSPLGVSILGSIAILVFVAFWMVRKIQAAVEKI